MDQKDNHTEDRRADTGNDPSHHAPGAGITNRPDDEEIENQQRLPPRGHAKDED